MTAPIRTVLSIGATGSIGRHVVDELLANGTAVRALVRDVDRARRLLPDGVELVLGDLTDQESVADAVAGVDAIILTQGGSASREVDYLGTKHVLEAIGDAAPRISLMTSMAVTTRPDMWKRRAERLVRASGLEYTIVRPGWFDYEEPHEQALLLEQGDRSPVDSHRGVGRRQIAATLVHSLTADSARATTFELFARAGEPPTNWEAVFAPLVKDDLDALAGGKDGGYALADEPAEVLADIAAIRSA